MKLASILPSWFRGGPIDPARPRPRPRPRPFANDRERLESLRRQLDEVRRRAEARLGADDVAHIETVDRLSRRFRRVGHVLAVTSLEPVSFGMGVVSLWIYKQLQAIEIGHTVLHGTYDRFPELGHLRAESFAWDIAIDEATWRHAHNLNHHGFTNVIGMDHDSNHGYMRVNPRVPYRWYHRVQLLSFAATVANTGVAACFLHAGLIEVYSRRTGDDLAILKDRSWASIAAAHRAFLRKVVPYYVRTYLLTPALAGPLAWKLWLAHLGAESIRDVFTGLAIFCSHVGEDIADFPAGTRAHGRGQWYEMQAAATRNFEVPAAIVELWGGLEHQIEHHLFPKLPPNRLREIAPEVRAICETHGVPYRSDPWPRTLAKLARQLVRLSRPPQTGSR